MQELRKLDAGDIPVFVGGTIPAVDRAELMDAGVMAIFTAEMRLDDVVAEVARALTPVQAA